MSASSCSLVVVLSLFSVVYCNLKSPSSQPTVKIWQGELQGFVDISYGNHEFYSFLGIPYAKPPLGKLRFQPPEEPKQWEGVLDATSPGSQCWQFHISETENNNKSSEDCLVLNVFTNKIPDSGSLTNGVPVMVWFHGGGLQFGSSDPEVFGTHYLIDHDVVLVTINYRLGILGFLSTGDSVVPGNMGLKDQVMALKWVQKNIAAFGGDPNRVTIFGESAGASSVHYHMLSPMSKGLFHRAITQSGVAHCPWAFMEPKVIPSRLARIGEATKCPIEISEEFLECLQELDPQQLVDIPFTKVPYHFIYGTSPTVEIEGNEKFLPKEPVKLMKEGSISNVPWLTGFNKDEGAYRVAAYWENEMFVKMLNRTFSMVGANILRLDELFTSLKDSITLNEKIREFYYGKEDISDENFQPFINIYTDRLFLYHIHTAVNLHKENAASPIYYYELTHRGAGSLTEMITGSKRDFGVSHADDLQYLFKGMWFETLENLKEENHDDRILSKLMTKMWTDFAKTGNPTPADTIDHSIRWDPITKTSEITYLNLNPNNPRMMKGVPYSERMEFWRSNPLPESGWEIAEQEESAQKDEL